MASARVRTRETKSGEVVAYSETAVRQNLINIEYVKTSLSSLAGCTAGILGLTGLYGFIFYILALLSFFGFFVLKTGSKWNKYFISRNALVTNGFLGGLCTYILFWTFAYGCMHVY